ncbi:MAG TPA: sialidase family protein [Gemmatimonadota bacterium]|nr:sialidase family protein [Gemmatimonadota bacterium]
MNPRRGSAVAGRQVGPRIQTLAGGEVAVSWVDRARDPAGDIVVSLSTDAGRSFSPPVRVNDDSGAAGQEYQDMTALPGGGVAIVWLDEREADPGSPNEKQVYFTTSADCRVFEPNEAVTSTPGGVCTCCRPGIAAGADGSLHVVYRDRDGESLVLRVASRRPGAARFEPAVPLSLRGWRYPACPTDAPSIVAGPGDRVRVAWMDASGGRATLWLASSADGGRSFAPAEPIEGQIDMAPIAMAPDLLASAPVPASAPDPGACCLGSAHPGRPVLARHSRDGLAVVFEDDLGRVWARVIDGPVPGRLELAGGDDLTARSPHLAAAAEGFHAFWIEERWLPGDPGAAGQMSSSLHDARLMLLDGRLTMMPPRTGLLE